MFRIPPRTIPVRSLTIDWVMLDFFCRANSPPTFTVIPGDVNITDGQTIVLKASVDGKYQAWAMIMVKLISM